ncbi:hypothetical protein [Fundidesulfovibrio terrae]|uniref:hypothetical protein n=1 Tax=Fundidesulfovibrio terrae TaxID=2922866 RepID=UPI001FAF8633|nr:hypothetical protein [Fundidesulfovibrio terrae]
MHTPRLAALLAACLLVTLAAAQARAEAKHFWASQRHFEELATKAATLAADMDAPGEKNACNYFTATAMTYAVRAHAMAQLSDVAAQVSLPGDKALLRQKLAETRSYADSFIEGDLKVIESLASTSKNSRIREIGLRLANELRVFERNLAAAVGKN